MRRMLFELLLGVLAIGCHVPRAETTKLPPGAAPIAAGIETITPKALASSERWRLCSRVAPLDPPAVPRIGSPIDACLDVSAAAETERGLLLASGSPGRLIEWSGGIQLRGIAGSMPERVVALAAVPGEGRGFLLQMTSGKLDYLVFDSRSFDSRVSDSRHRQVAGGRRLPVNMNGRSLCAETAVGHRGLAVLRPSKQLYAYVACSGKQDEVLVERYLLDLASESVSASLEQTYVLSFPQGTGPAEEARASADDSGPAVTNLLVSHLTARGGGEFPLVVTWDGTGSVMWDGLVETANRSGPGRTEEMELTRVELGALVQLKDPVRALAPHDDCFVVMHQDERSFVAERSCAPAVPCPCPPEEQCTGTDTCAARWCAERSGKSSMTRTTVRILCPPQIDCPGVDGGAGESAEMN